MTLCYVYTLKDERGIPFYVGKGCGQRALAHVFRTDTAGGQEKQAIINRITADGVPLTIEIAGWFDSDIDARRREGELIDALGVLSHRTGTLTNRNRPGTAVDSGSVRITARARSIAEPFAKREKRSLTAQIEVIIEEWSAAKKPKS